MKANRLELNLAMIGSHVPPDESKPAISLNGVKLDGVVSILMKAAADSLTEVTIKTYCEVVGVVEVDTDHLTVDDANQPQLFES